MTSDFQHYEAYARHILGPGFVALRWGDPLHLVIKPLRLPPRTIAVRLDPEEVRRFALGDPAPSFNDFLFPFLPGRSLNAALAVMGKAFSWGRPEHAALIDRNNPPPSWVPLAWEDFLAGLVSREADKVLAVTFARRSQPAYFYLRSLGTL